ncbi:MAG: hypothetical protein CXT69_03225 [Methanobacteriota archaeon]|jgi:DNA recombination protein RmuC|nr:MAG: hypothetical protein CXT69_03225 [Euryarchaeota archaeon]HIK79083.1 DNA recombination protein RmuC [Candidatus Poseidoniales archaeon]
MTTILDIGLLIIASALGFIIGWLISNQRSNGELQDARVNASGMEAKYAAQVEALATTKETMQSEFQAMATNALQSNSDTFLQVAEAKLQVKQKEGEKVLAEQKQAMEHLVEPIKDTLSKLEKSTNELEKNREGAYQGLKRQVEDLSKATLGLLESSNHLSTALRGSSKARGNWGEVALKNIAEYAGMLEHCDFDVEHTLISGAGGKRVDMVTKIPGGGGIPVDSKVPLTNYWDGMELDDIDQRKAFMIQHAKDVKKHVDELARRDYSGIMGVSGTDFTVMFIPSEPVLSAAFEHDPGLQEYSFNKKVLIVTPVTLIALLRTVAIYWQQQVIAENANEILEHSQEFYKRTATFSEHFSKVGTNLGKAIATFNKAAGSFQSQVIPSGRRLKELKVTEGVAKELQELKIIDETPRAIPLFVSEEE